MSVVAEMRTLDLDGDLAYAALAPLLESVRILLRQRGRLMVMETANGLPCHAFFVQVPMVARNGFLDTRLPYVQCLERALAYQPETGERDQAIMELLRMRRALRAQLDFMVGNKVMEEEMVNGEMVPCATTPPMMPKKEGDNGRDAARPQESRGL